MDDRILVRVRGDLRRAIERLAEKDRRTLSDYVRILLEDHVATRKGGAK